MKIKLPIELVPSSSHYNNLRSMLKASEWTKLRKKIIPPLNNKCEICGGHSYNRSLDLHEVWSYDIKTGVQKLVRLEGLCSMCHEVKHFYLAKLKGKEKRARKRLMDINGFSAEECYLYELKTHKQYIERSNVNWSLNTEYLKNI